MDINQIRQKFKDFFESKGHEIVTSAPMVVKNDPTLMFINAGMNQFKDYFLGNEEPQYPRVVNSQKCLRVSGKHNDLEEVGVDTYHHTMFEMLGNWSFGDFFKKEAIEWAWELLTEVYKIPKDQLYVTIFEGDESDGVPEDSDALKIWKGLIDEDRIIKANKKDNFWEMGETGPCGPCSEIHVDIRHASERAKGDGKSLVNQDHPQVIEVWNLVFIQFNRKADGSLENLPQKHVDTGMGLERLAMVLQGKISNYDTDLFQTLIREIENISGKIYRDNNSTDIAMRVIADHIRAVSFSIADGQLPASNGAGYVIRRILRRAIRYGYQTLGIEAPFMHRLVPVLSSLMGAAFQELRKQESLIARVIEEEEESFYKTLEQGLKKLDQLFDKHEKEKLLQGQAVFELYDTFGFPYDLTHLIASEKGFKLDEKGFLNALNEQKDRSRAAGKITSDDWVVIKQGEPEFIGYDATESEIKILRYRKVKQKNKEFYQLVFTPTPFYPEGGGQVGDQGLLYNNNEKIAVVDTKKENNLIVHTVNKLPNQLEVSFKASVDQNKRLAAMGNHTATHLLHHVLREVLGTHVEQKGSLVHPDYLRFDFSHFSKVTVEELQSIEQKVNAMVRQNLALDERRSVPVDEAMEMGAMALFGEKYGEEVRVIKFGPSIELCGGTHIHHTGSIGFFKITSESAVASGVRRIEAISGTAAEAYISENLNELHAVKELLKAQKSAVKAVEQLQEKQQKLEKQLQQLEAEKGQSEKKEWLQQIKTVNGIPFLGAVTGLDNAQIKDLLFQLRNEQPELVAAIGTHAGGKAGLNILIADKWVKEKEWNAGKWVREIAQEHIQGGGGGQPFFAIAGGKKTDGLQGAVKAVEEKLG